MTEDKALEDKVDRLKVEKFNTLPVTERTYASFVSTCNIIGKKYLPKRPPRTTSTIDSSPMKIAREETLIETTSTVQHHQSKQRLTFDKLEEDRINSTLAKFEDPTGNPKTAWKIIKELTGKKKNIVYIQDGE